MSRRPLLLAVLLACGVAWGSTQSLGKISVSTGHGPFGLLFWQMAIGAVLMAGIGALRRRPLRLTRDAWTFGVVVALVGTLIPGTLFYVSVERLPAGIMSILISAVPLMAFPMALLLGQDRFSAARLMGLALGIAGVALIALPDASLPEPGMAAWIPFALIGPFFYAVESNFVARFGMAGMDPVQAMGLASAIGSVLALPLALGSGQFVDLLVPWGRAEWALLVGSVVHVLTYAAFVWLAANAGSTFASQSSYVVTASGLVWAMALLGESFSSWVWLALLLMLGGLLLVQPRASSLAGAEAARL